MHPSVAIGRFSLPSYTVLLDAAILIGLVILYGQARKFRRSPWTWIDGGLLAIVVGIIGGRIGFAAIHWDYFVDHLGEVWQVWRGGLDGYGALTGGFLALLAWCRWRHEPLSRILDTLALVFVQGAMLIWIGCLLSGYAYGREVASPSGMLRWLAPILPDAYGVVASRYATQAFGAAWAAIVGLLLLRIHRPLPVGARFALSVLLYSAGSIVVDSTRGDAVPLILGWRVDQALDASLIAISLVWLGWKIRQGKIEGAADDYPA